MSHRLSPLALSLALCCAVGTAQATNFPVTEAQKDTASRVAQSGVPLSELAANAPDSYTVKSGDTLWAISSIFLKTPWRWPELWGMNRQQIANPHLIYPGQTLFLVKRDGRATLEMAADVGGASSRMQPRVRSSALGDNAVASIPQQLIEPFLNEAVVFDTDALASAPRIVAAPENRVLMTQGDLAYVRGIKQPQNEYRVFRQATPLTDPKTGELLGYEARFSATAQLTRLGGQASDGKGAIEVPATITLGSVRNEVNVGDRLAPVPPRVFSQYIPHAPDKPVSGHIVSIYGDALTAGQNQIVAINKGLADGMERGHVLTMWRAGKRVTDRTIDRPEAVQLPDEQHGVLFVFQTFQRVSYALIISVKEPVTRGDRFTQP